MDRTADMARALVITAMLVACKQVDPPTGPPTTLEPTPFDDILPGFEDPGTYEVPTHTVWTLDEPERWLTAIEVHDFDGDGTIELVAAAPTNGGWEDTGRFSGVYWPEDLLAGGALEDHRPITWDGTERNVATGLARVGDALVVGSTPFPLVDEPLDPATYVFEDGWRSAFVDASYVLEHGGTVVADLNADGVPDLVGSTDGVAGPIGPGAEPDWSWDLRQQALSVHDGDGWVALEDGVGLPLVAFVPKPVPMGDIPDFGPWAWSGPQGMTITHLGPALGSVDAWLVRARPPGEQRSSTFFVHPEVDTHLGEAITIHDHVGMSPSAAEGDFDGDGVDEVVLTTGQTYSGGHVFVSIFRTPLPAVASEQDAWVRLHLPAGAGYIVDLEVVDVDDDGRDDLVVAYGVLSGPGGRVVVITADDIAARVP